MRKILIAAGVGAVAIAGAFFYLLDNLDSLVKTAIEEAGSRVAGVKVSVADVKIAIKEGRGTIKGLTVANPKGFTSPTAISLGEVAVALDTGSITRNPVVITDVLVAAPQVTYELAAGGSNIDAIRKNVQSFAGGGKSEPAAKDGASKKLVVDKLVVKDGKVSLATPLPGGKAGASLPDIQLTNIGKASGGATAAEVAGQLLDAISKTALKSVAGLGIDSVVQGAKGAAGDAVKGGLDQFKGMLGK